VNPLVGNEWSAVNSINVNNSLVWLQIGLGGNRIYSTNGGLAPRPAVATADPWGDLGVRGYEVRWSHTSPNILYYVEPEQAYYSGPDVPGPSYIKSLDVRNGDIKVLHTFQSYRVLHLSTSDLSPDGDYMAILGNGRYGFWYRISSDT